MNIGELSKPVNTLVEKVSDAIGGLYRPYQIVRVAKAEAEADKIKALSQIEITDLQRRALHRFLAEETSKQINMEMIADGALSQIEDTAKPEEISRDWMTTFFDKCRLVSEEQMRGLWSKILAGEANAPGSFSKRTLSIVENIDKYDAERFASVCSFGVRFDNELTLLIYGVNDPIFKENGISTGLLSHLQTIGLISFELAYDYLRHFDSRNLTASYQGTVFRVQLSAIASGKPVNMGSAMLTDSGQQVANLFEARPIPGFLEWLVRKWAGMPIGGHIIILG